MPKVKIPRKSTNIDMTAMCDVAFLLLSFFILATKTKPPEAVRVTNPSSVSTQVAADKAIVVTLTKEGKVYLLLSDPSHKKQILDAVNTNRALGLTKPEMDKLNKSDYIGMPLNQLKGWLDMPNEIPANQMPGIPIQDSTNNELTDWIRAVSDAYAGEDSKKMQILVKGDNLAKYPAFKSIKYAFKKNDIYKFKIITNPEGVPADSELAKNPPKADTK
jgi:biopolymer transport protein ExbD